MRLRKFKSLINKAEKDLKIKINNEYFYEGICIVLDDNFDNMFDKFDKTVNDGQFKYGYWVGDLCEENLPLRKTLLRLFEQYCITEKIYLGLK